MKVEWSSDASNDLRDIADHVAQHSPRAAAALDARLLQAAANLAAFPLIGHIGAMAGTREILAHPHYRMVYSVIGETIWIEAVVHTSRQWPPVRDEDS